MSYESDTIDINLTVRYDGIKATQYFSKWTQESFNMFREDLTTLRMPHPKRDNTTFASYGHIKCTWPAAQKNGVLHNQIRRTQPGGEKWASFKIQCEALQITSFKANYIDTNAGSSLTLKRQNYEGRVDFPQKKRARLEEPLPPSPVIYHNPTTDQGPFKSTTASGPANLMAMGPHARTPHPLPQMPPRETMPQRPPPVLPSIPLGDRSHPTAKTTLGSGRAMKEGDPVLITPPAVANLPVTTHLLGPRPPPETPKAPAAMTGRKTEKTVSAQPPPNPAASAATGPPPHAPKQLRIGAASTSVASRSTANSVHAIIRPEPVVSESRPPSHHVPTPAKALPPKPPVSVSGAPLLSTASQATPPGSAPPEFKSPFESFLLAAESTGGPAAVRRLLINPPPGVKAATMANVMGELTRRRSNNDVYLLLRGIWEVRRDLEIKRVREAELIARLHSITADFRMTQAVPDSDDTAKEMEVLKGKIAQGMSELKKAKDKAEGLTKDLQNEQQLRQEFNKERERLLHLKEELVAEGFKKDRELEVAKDRVVDAERKRLEERQKRQNLEKVQERLLEVEKELEAERRRRQDAEDAIADVRRECRAPFVVPSLLDAFVELSRLTTKATVGVGAVNASETKPDNDPTSSALATIPQVKEEPTY